MKKVCLLLSIVTSLSLYATDNTSKANKAEKAKKEKPQKVSKSQPSGINPDYGRGRGFIGPEIGFGGLGTVSIGAMGGYQYYFKEAWQFAGFRHGVRGFGTIDWATNNSVNGFFVQVGADWTFEFTPRSRFVWGVFIGPSFGYASLSSSLWNLGGFVISGNLGASVTIDKRHRVDLALGAGFSIFSLRYLFHF